LQRQAFHRDGAQSVNRPWRAADFLVPGNQPVPYRSSRYRSTEPHQRHVGEDPISHYEKQLRRAVKRLNAIDAELASLDWPLADFLNQWP